MIRVSLFTLLLGLGLAAPAAAQNRPSFACANASEGAERAICRSAELSRLDRTIAAAYARARRMLDAAGREALLADQETFLQSREAAIAESPKALRVFMRERLTLLAAMVAPPPGGGDAGLLGEWHDVSGIVRVTRVRDGKLKVSISTSTPVTGMRACGVEETATPNGGRLAFRMSGHADIGVTVERRGAVLQVTHDGDLSLVCGHGGWLQGGYFRVNWPGRRELPM